MVVLTLVKLRSPLWVQPVKSPVSKPVLTTRPHTNGVGVGVGVGGIVAVAVAVAVAVGVGDGVPVDVAVAVDVAVDVGVGEGVAQVTVQEISKPFDKLAVLQEN